MSKETPEEFLAKNARRISSYQPAHLLTREPTRPNGHDESNPPLRGEPIESGTRKFKVERWSEIGFDLNTEWLIKGVLPKQGVGLIYGKSQSFKSFVAMHMALCVTLGRFWACKRVEKTPVAYIAAEGAHGLRKRKAGYIRRGAICPPSWIFISFPPRQISEQRMATLRRSLPRLKARASILV